MQDLFQDTSPDFSHEELWFDLALTKEGAVSMQKAVNATARSELVAIITSKSTNEVDQLEAQRKGKQKQLSCSSMKGQLDATDNPDGRGDYGHEIPHWYTTARVKHIDM